MKLYLAYKFTGENFEVLKSEMDLISNTLKELGNEKFCSFERENMFKENSYSAKDIIKFSLDQMNSCDAVLVYLKSNEKSEGMLIEIGYALAKNKKIYLLAKEDIKTYFVHGVADKVVVFRDTLELEEKTRELFA